MSSCERGANRQTVHVWLYYILAIIAFLFGPHVYNQVSGPFPISQAGPERWYVRAQGMMGAVEGTLSSADRRSGTAAIVRRRLTSYARLTTEAGVLYCTQTDACFTPGPAEVTGTVSPANPTVEERLNAPGSLHLELRLGATPLAMAGAGICLFLCCAVGLVLSWPGRDPGRRRTRRDLERVDDSERVRTLHCPWQGSLSTAVLVLVLGLGADAWIGRGIGAWGAAVVTALLAIDVLVRSRRDRYMLTDTELFIDTAQERCRVCLDEVSSIHREDRLDGSTETVVVRTRDGRRLVLDVTGRADVGSFLHEMSQRSGCEIRLQPPPSPRGGPVFNARLAAGLLLVCVLCLAVEGGLRALALPSLNYVPDPEMGFVPVGPGLRTLDEMRSDCATPLRHLLVVGSTFDGGERVLRSSQYCDRLRARLSGRVGVLPEVVDATVDGYGPAQTLRLAHDLVDRCSVDLMVVLLVKFDPFIYRPLASGHRFRNRARRLLLASEVGRRLRMAVFPMDMYQDQAPEDMLDAPPEMAAWENLVELRKFADRGTRVLIVQSLSTIPGYAERLRGYEARLALPFLDLDDAVPVGGDGAAESAAAMTADRIVQERWLAR